MAAFSSFVDSFFLPNNSSTIKFCDFLEQPNNADLYHHQNLDHSIRVSDFSNNEVNMNTIDTSSIITGNSSEQITQEPNPMHKKRKGRVGSFANSAQSKDMREVKGKKQKEMKICEEKKKSKKEEKKATEEPPTGYVHVRARRGQATDSHSLAERVRRERISERMKLLQSIVPGCDKVTGKAHMLDEIINYVQSLQHQVEFLSLKLASVNPMFYDFGMDLESSMLDPDQNTSSLPSPMENMQECSPETANYYTLLDNTANSLLFQQSQVPNVLPQGNRQVLWEMEEQRQKIMNQSGFNNNLFSFR